MPRRVAPTVLPLALAGLLSLASPPTPSLAADEARGLEIYYVDTDGGAATLIVTPARESLLIDCGNPGVRDATRIADAAKKAGLTAIDHLVITHWHSDHYGGVGHLSKLLPIRNYYDRGIPESLEEDKTGFPTLIKAYKAASGSKSKALRPGDEVKLLQPPGAPPLSLVCLCGSGDTVPDRKGDPENPAAKDHTPMKADPSDNARSLGFLLKFGEFRFLDLGDLTWNKEYLLVHPTDKIGKVDIYQTTHHGLEISNNPVLLRTVSPRVAIFNNGPKKGCHPSVTKELRRLPEIQAIFQMHRNATVGDAENTDVNLIANAPGASGEMVRVAVAPDAKTYTVVAGPKGKVRKFETRGR